LAKEISKSKFSYLIETFLELEISGRMLIEIENKNELFEAMESWSDQLSDNDSKNELLNEFNVISKKFQERHERKLFWDRYYCTAIDLSKLSIDVKLKIANFYYSLEANKHQNGRKCATTERFSLPPIREARKGSACLLII
jgi:hypothetical protein